MKPRKAYLKQFAEVTRKSMVHEGFATALNLKATLLTPTFRQQLAEERRRLMNADPADHEAFVARMKADGDAFHEVILVADSSLPQGKKFGDSDDRWRVRLEADGTIEPLVAIEHVRRPSPLHRGLYPTIDQWADLWIARFERTVDNPRSIELHVGSGYGHTSVTWDPDR